MEKLGKWGRLEIEFSQFGKNRKYFNTPFLFGAIRFLSKLPILHIFWLSPKRSPKLCPVPKKKTTTPEMPLDCQLPSRGAQSLETTRKGKGFRRRLTMHPPELSGQNADRSIPPEKTPESSATDSPARPTPDSPLFGSGQSAPPGSSQLEAPLQEDSSQGVLPEKRARFVGWVVAGGILCAGLAALGWLGYEIRRLDPLQPVQLRHSVAHLKQAAAGIACLGAVGFLGAAGWLCRLGWKITRTGQYPPPGMKLLWKSQIRSGPAASLRAHFAYLLAVVLAAWGSLGMIWLYQQAEQALQTLLSGR